MKLLLKKNKTWRMRKLTSTETKAILKISDCELMHMRIQGKIVFDKQGRSYLYELPEGYSILQHPLGNKLLHWYSGKHSFSESNTPVTQESASALERLLLEILLPINRAIGKPDITYGFTSFSLKKYIQRFSPNGTSPDLDQHSAFEKNSNDKQICSRGGAACDFLIEGVSSSDIVRYIVKNLNYDRIYYYGVDRPLHVSIHPTEPLKHLQVMGTSSKGRRYPSTKAFGDDAVKLAEKL